MKHNITPMVLIVLDGWGYREAQPYNAISQAKTPHWDDYWQRYTHTLISGSGTGVGLPDGQMGNSEVGHLNIGAGRIVHQDFSRIEAAIADGDFFSNPVFVQAIQHAVTHNKAVHVLGLLSPGGVHSHEQQLFSLLTLAAKQGAHKLFLHAFLDGRDTPPKSAAPSIQHAESLFSELGVGKIASICGRYYAMDRDKRWERIQRAYDLLTEGSQAFHATSALEGLNMAYARGESDEFVEPTAIFAGSATPHIIENGDVVIFMNYRADRARELSRALIEDNFAGFERKRRPILAKFVTLTQYAEDIPSQVAFPPINLNNVLGEWLAKFNLKQLRIAETEKYAHVTFFMNGGVEKPFEGEDRILIPSPKVATYDLEPEMSAFTVTEKLISAIKNEKYALIICNFANPDMVGHTGDFDATVKAIETIDKCLGEIVNTAISLNMEVLVTADHGNAELMYDEDTQQTHTAHTSNPVPLLYIGRKADVLQEEGKLSDIAPTLLTLMHLPIPEEMTGHILFAPHTPLEGTKTQ